MSLTILPDDKRKNPKSLTSKQNLVFFSTSRSHGWLWGSQNRKKPGFLEQVPLLHSGLLAHICTSGEGIMLILLEPLDFMVPFLHPVMYLSNLYQQGERTLPPRLKEVEGIELCDVGPVVLPQRRQRVLSWAWPSKQGWGSRQARATAVDWEFDAKAIPGDVFPICFSVCPRPFGGVKTRCFSCNRKRFKMPRKGEHVDLDC